jgi:anhydro-N-acetylmuramic acid kinase
MSSYIGLMSGTSLDGIDAVLLQQSDSGWRISDVRHQDYEPQLLARLRAAIEQPHLLGINELGELDTLVGEAFAQAALALQKHCGLATAQIRAIGSHGQTVRHQPHGTAPFTLQIGDPNVIAERTGIDVVADFRRRDVAAGGEGAPLVPAFHSAVFGAVGKTRVVVNIGGIANITVLPVSGPILGFDTGAGNCLMDGWMQRHFDQAFDKGGALACTGMVCEPLLGILLAEPYLQRQPPKSTGRELFHLSWLDAQLDSLGQQLTVADVQATLCEFTARSIAAAILSWAAGATDVVVCGGGAFNTQLLHRLRACLPELLVQTSDALGLAPLQVEAAAFAWLAHQRLLGAAGNLPSVTGAKGPRPLGAIYAGSVTKSI